ncbi:LysR substrate-binding domain-containing protein [Paraburkholderia tropica]|uniref:LysR substrate-binding domain-containing protein n=1 Tax=Paraburkholderia tropica TaxID=92647 RepID=UPI0015901B0A|nr:LysR substrate-binding domain-containing protein [Paraburkholderia tropica]
MDLRQLRYFVTLAEVLHFSSAAELLGVAPSALSMQIQSLERELGVQLFARTTRSVSLNAAGRVFLKEARVTLDAAENARRVAMMAGRAQLGSLEIGYVFSAACSGVAQQLLAQQQALYPEVKTTLHPMESPAQLEALRNKKLDACLIRLAPDDDDDLERILLHGEKLLVALPEMHSLAQETVLAAGDLKHCKFAVPQFDGDVGFVQHLFAIGRGAGFYPEIAWVTKDFLTALVHVASGSAIAVVPESIGAISLPGLTFRPFVDVLDRSELHLVVRRADRTPNVASLRALAQSVGRRRASQT